MIRDIRRRSGRASTIVNGRLSRPGDVDGYSVRLDRGQTLVADLEANRHLGSPMDAVLQVVSAEGFVLAQNDDAVGRDPRIIFEAPTGGTYIVRLFAFPLTPNSSIRFAGGDAFIYRLTLTTGGFLEHVFPLAVSQDCSTPMTAIGSNISECRPRFDDSSDRGNTTCSRSIIRCCRGMPRSGASRAIRSSRSNPTIWLSLKSSRTATRSAGESTLQASGMSFGSNSKKGEKHVFSLESRTLGLPLDAVLQVLDADGKTLAETDDVGNSRDPELTFTPPADGKYRVVVRDLNGRGGPHYAYLLRALAPEPDFTLSLSADKFNVTAGKETKVVVNIARINGFTDTIDVMAEELPDGVLATTARSRQSDASARSVTLEDPRRWLLPPRTDADHRKIGRRKAAPANCLCADPRVRSQDGSSLAYDSACVRAEETVGC